MAYTNKPKTKKSEKADREAAAIYLMNVAFAFDIFEIEDKEGNRLTPKVVREKCKKIFERKPRKKKAASTSTKKSKPKKKTKKPKQTKKKES